MKILIERIDFLFWRSKFKPDAEISHRVMFLKAIGDKNEEDYHGPD